MSHTMRHYSDEKLSALAAELGAAANRLQREAAQKQRLADRARKEIKRRKREEKP